MFFQSLMISITLLGTVSAAPGFSPPNNPPMRAIRISDVEGSVHWQMPSEPTLHIARVNDVLSEGDSVDTGDNARAELHLGLIVVWVAPRTRMMVKALTDNDFVVQLERGSISADLTRLPDNQHIELAAENASLRLEGIGTYRVSLNANDHRAGIMVREGTATLTLGPSQRSLTTNQSVQLSRSDAPVLADASARDAFDAWCDDRTQHAAQSKALKYVSRDVVGWEDLDGHGNWVDTSDGPAWQPSDVNADWAPYSQGQWEWSDVYGWTWVDDASWGYAPSHYGRWGYYDDAWAWVPGPAASAAVYSPALVAFMNINAFADGLIATWAYASWFPLAPGEPYMPGYHTTDWYIAHMNEGIPLNVVPGINRSAPHAVVAVRDKVMQAGTPVAPARQTLSSQARQYAPATGGFASVLPREISPQRTGPRSASASTPPAWAVARRVQLMQAFRASAAQPMYRTSADTAPQGRNYAADHLTPRPSTSAAALVQQAAERGAGAERVGAGAVERRGAIEQPSRGMPIPREAPHQAPAPVHPAPVVPRAGPPAGAIPLPRALGGPRR